jgi:iron complex transport system ATP-binding protein
MLLEAIMKFPHEMPTTFGQRILNDMLNQTRGLTVIMSLHDLNQAAQFADHVLVLEEGRVKAAGTPNQVITETLLAQIFRVRGAVTLNDEGRPYCVGHGTTKDLHST